MKNKEKTILIIGNAGFIGNYFFDYYNSKPGFNVYGLDLKNINNKNLLKGDILNLSFVEERIHILRPDIVINFAAISNLNICEERRDFAHRVNVLGNKNIVNSIIKNNKKIKYVFLSSDYIFEGIKGDYKEIDEPNPKTYYGITKLKAEDYIRNNLDDYVICRSANVYGHGGNFFNFILNNLNANKEIDVYKDTFFNPTFVGNLIEMVDSIISGELAGVFHTVGGRVESRYSFAMKIAEVFKKDKNLVIPIKKPKEVLILNNSSLNFSKTKARLKNVKFLNIDQGLTEIVRMMK